MKRIKIALAACLLVPTVLWLFADTLWPETLNYFSFRRGIVQLSGILLIAAMSVAMMLALRWKWLEPHLDGLDKMYRLHKWLGIAALIIGAVHWWWAKFTKWMIGWGWLSRPASGPGSGSGGGQGPGSGGGQGTSELQNWLSSQHGLAETVGEWGFYVAVILIALALIKRFKYHHFISTHKILAITYLLFAYHALILMRFNYWTQPIAWLVVALVIGGTYAAVVILFKKIGANRKVSGQVIKINYSPSLQIMDTLIQLDEGWPGHKAGQFTFVSSSERERAHPYTIASSWDPAAPNLRLIIKELGDHTSRLPKQLTVGTAVTVEGPYGCFNFEDKQPWQIWVGAGIGITPFIARMQYLRTQAGSKNIVLFHPTASSDQEALGHLQSYAAQAGVRLHIVIDGRDPLLSGQRIRELVPEWLSASIWFCGPAGFGDALKKDFKAQGLPVKHFHQELFNMR
ncbi:MAG: ferric reductase-like transmembrane domain-containing protein [Alcaligenaceae bacterium]|nr:ferric reductase-like transmembrane domain-containing protein [Alcaligenaceae bacterium]